MDGLLKFYLLAEESGWNCSSYAFEYGPKIKDSQSYKILQSNLPEIRKSISGRANDIVVKSDSLRFDPKSVADCFILENKVNYLALHSFPEYYLNPLTIDPNYNGEVKSLGDLVFDYQGQECTLNDIILNDKDSLEIKKAEVNQQLEYFLSDANTLVYSSLAIVKKNAFSSQKNKKNQIIGTILEILLFISLNVFFAVMCIYPFPTFRLFLYYPDPSRVMTYLWYLYPILLFLFDLAFIVFHSYRAKISEPYNYAVRFLRKNSAKVFDDLRNGKEKIFDYIAGAINNRLVLKNDIKDFSKLSSSYIDFKAVINVSSLKEKRPYKVLRSLNVSFGTLAAVMGAISLIVFILGIAFNVAI
ncbi:MAG: hypothetical protein WCR56_07495 [Bacilli bacterium]